MHMNIPSPCKLCALPIHAFLGFFFYFFFRVTRVNHQPDAEIGISISDLLAEAHELVLIRTCFSLIMLLSCFCIGETLYCCGDWWQCISLL